ncbi:MAG: hypothetical protein GY868_00275 [Deltaproteobacteria bacterium]|nr:hypothetical protein [Deltaproteobacteria bacterium]
MCSYREHSYQNGMYPLTVFSIATIPLAWLAGILSLQIFGLFMFDSLSFFSSCAGALLGTFLLWAFFINKMDRMISLQAIFIIFALKAAFVYVIWSNYVYAPGDSADLVVTKMHYFEEPCHYWVQIKKIYTWWVTNGFTLSLPEYYLNINHPEAMLLLSLPFTALPPHSEVLIPWNMFYTTAAAAAIYAVGRLEGYKQYICRYAFYVILLQPFGWYVFEPLKRDAQCQMFFGVFLLAVLYFRERIIPLIITALIGAAMLYLYRSPYAPAIILTAVYAYARSDGVISMKIQIRIIVACALVFALFFVTPQRYVDNIFASTDETIEKYGIGDAGKMAKRGYQKRITGHGSFAASLPERIMLGLMSPFPWTNIFDSRNPFGVTFRLTDYLHTALLFVCFTAIVVFGFMDFRHRIIPPASVVFALIIAISGMVGIAVQNVYVQVGMLSTFPYVMHKLGAQGMVRWCVYCLLFFLTTSILWYFVR